MSDSLYSDNFASVKPNMVTVAQAASPNLVLTKRNFPDHQVAYDRVKYFNFYEVEIWNLHDLFLLSQRMLAKPRCCFLRARVKDMNNRKHVVRKYVGDEATLVLEDQNWFALDIDGLSTKFDDDQLGDMEGYHEDWKWNLQAHLNNVLMKLPLPFSVAECFAVASASYSIKPDIRMRVFFWADRPVSNYELKTWLKADAPGAAIDLTLFNPIQPIYTAAPIFVGITDPVKQRILWYGGESKGVSVTMPPPRRIIDEEVRYTKQSAKRISESLYFKIGRLGTGERHNMLFGYCILLGKLIGQNVLDEIEAIESAYDSCNDWSGQRNFKKDMQTILDGIKMGKQAIYRENVK
jgi:hypothetical protein